MSRRQRDTREHARRAAELRRRVQARRTRMRRAVAANVAVVVVFAGLVVGWLAGVGEDTPAPAPAIGPWFIPRLKPCAPLTALIVRIACWESAATSAVSSTVRSV